MSQLSSGDCTLGRGYLFLARDDNAVVWQAIEKLCRRSEAEDVGSLIERLNRYGEWESEDLDEERSATTPRVTAAD